MSLPAKELKEWMEATGKQGTKEYTDVVNVVMAEMKLYILTHLCFNVSRG
jgi:hypothetical protein